jgi:hypothetical protein
MMARLRADMSCGWLVIVVSSEMKGLHYLGRLVLGGSEEVGAVGGELEIVDLVVELVGLDVLQLLTGLKQHT